MKKILLGSALLLSFVACSTLQHDPWTTEDKMLEGTWQTLHAIDWSQTLNISDREDRYHEINPLIGEHPSRTKVNTVMGAAALLHPIVVNWLPRKVKVFGFDLPARAIFQSISISSTGGLVTSNFDIGLRITF
jgi:hypothetical protein